MFIRLDPSDEFMNENDDFPQIPFLLFESFQKRCHFIELNNWGSNHSLIEC